MPLNIPEILESAENACREAGILISSSHEANLKSDDLLPLKDALSSYSATEGLTAAMQEIGMVYVTLNRLRQDIQHINVVSVASAAGPNNVVVIRIQIQIGQQGPNLVLDTPFDPKVAENIMKGLSDAIRLSCPNRIIMPYEGGVPPHAKD